MSFLTAAEDMACGYQELGLNACPVGTHKSGILLICTREEALVPQPVPRMAVDGVGISGTDGSEQALKELPILLLRPYLPAASLPTITLFAATCTLELPFKLPVITIVTAGDQVSPGPQVNPLRSCCLIILQPKGQKAEQREVLFAAECSSGTWHMCWGLLQGFLSM